LKLVDITNPQYFPSSADGFDVDGIIICPGEVVAAITGEGRDGSPIANARTLNEGEAYSEDFFNKAPNEVYQNGAGRVSIYPNPVVSNNIRLTVDGEWEIAQYDIVDINGRILSVGHVERLNPTITMNSLNSGLYVLRVKIGGQQQAIKFTVKR
ncbi:MAG: T9SS type A sorting domain-containing protein, partial [Cyclobacteriaceae bacterium]